MGKPRQEFPEEYYESKPVKRSKSPRRKVVAGSAGGGFGGLLSVIIAYHFPEIPPTVTAAYASLIVGVLGFVVAYLVPPEDWR